MAPPLGRLARRSFELHAELAAELDGGRRWGYRRLDTWSVLAGARREPGRSRRAGPAWLGERALVQGQLGTPATTAQVHPARFTEAMLQAAIAMGARAAAGVRDGRRPRRRAHHGRGRQGRRRGARGGCHRHRHGAVVHAACRWLPLPAVSGLKGNSLVYQSGSKISADALFVELTTADGAAHTPEVFPRADGTTYVCGLSSQQALPDDPANVPPDPGRRTRCRR